MKPWRPVVSYRNSTSNHNEAGITRNQRSVVSYRNSTSNHNKRFAIRSVTLLYLIEILHQTTTIDSQLDKSKPLYLIEILHQTTTSSGPIVCITSCILSKFYIKPQLDHPSVGYCFVVSYRNSTSNHNSCLILLILRMVVSYRNSTSNHNSAFVTRSDTLLYLIEILHQTTTFDFRPRFSPGCILSKFYIKPQLICCSSVWRECCILSKFYIKPQPFGMIYLIFTVVSYRNSTSNHNRGLGNRVGNTVVSYRNSTSNHNLWTTKSASEMLYLIEILHQTTTTSKQSKESKTLYLIEILHQTTTAAPRPHRKRTLYLIEILHQTTTHYP